MNKKIKNILVTGGAGYIGSVAVKNLVEQGYKVIVVDSLFRGDSLLNYIKSVAKFYKIDIAKEKDKLEEMFKGNNFDAIMHFAAYKSVEESMKNPEKYQDNIIGTENVLELMAKYNINKIIFSSSAAVYNPSDHPLREDDQLDPLNVYGQTKLQCEQKIRDFCQKHKMIYANLRYFNVAGDGELGYVDPMPENVLPIIMETLIGKRKEFIIFGTDYASKDGTCVRDYIHVIDLVRAHILALAIEKSITVNLGTSKGYTVLELAKITEEITGKKLNYRFGPRRAGDPDALVASYQKAKEILNWEPEKDIREMIGSAFKVYEKL
ncbi:MAG: UDP-glucose 4-epimerase GalE [Candidatus Nealsonbacteria bacterium RBG_13_37_56]|uniref:UDP-glucose 4-epimerase n=1 Tax=Candidatus Nealsonbacteria bacterium RBG_13_37_56 TaxID=1801661 RepID=A0A1G2DW81_9BACT|nr:MAG: UDP-glucose 4-epimerase GalE [Candidatus Nealsonbacteria bacterium RBG_13_37_56]